MIRRCMPLVAVSCIALLGAGVSAADMPADVAAQVGKFKDPVPQTRQKALAELGKMGEKAKPALPEIVKMLDDKTTWVVTKALMVIKEIGPDEATLKAVQPVLGLTNEPEKRTMAAEIFAASDKSVPLLIESLKNDTQAEGAVEACALLGPKAKDAIPALTDVSAKHKSKPVRDAAAKALRAVKK